MVTNPSPDFPRPRALNGAIGAAAAASIIGGTAIALLVRMEGRLFAGTSPAVAEAGVGLLLAGALIAAAGAAGRIQRQPIWRTGARPMRAMAAGAAAGVAGLLAATLMAWLAGTLVPVPAYTHPGGAFLLGLAVIALQATGEEVFLRGWLQPVLQRGFGGIGGVAAASLIFALLHCVVARPAALSLTNMLLGGLFFGLLAWRSGGIAAPIAAHFGWNWAEAQLLGLTPNRGLGPFGTIFDLDLRGAAAWGGSAEGLNASLGTSFVLAALIVPLLVARSADDHAERSASLISLPVSQTEKQHAWLIGE